MLLLASLSFETFSARSNKRMLLFVAKPGSLNS